MNQQQEAQRVTPKANTSEPATSEAKHGSWRRRGQILLIASLLLALGTAVVAVHYVTPIVPGRAQSLPERLSWYLSRSQWRADSRTLAAAWDYFTQSDRELSVATNMPLATTTTESLPRS